MNSSHKSLIITFCIIFAFLLTGCQVLASLQPTPTSIPATQTATFTAIPTATATPTITPTPEPTLTPTPVYISIAANTTITAPIILYHHISPTITDSRYNIDPAKFEEQMKWLYDNGYSTITVTDLANLILEGGQIPLRPVVITFDDGNLDVYENAYPILKKYGFVATFYIVRNYINGSEMVTTEQLEELIQNGWEIGSHSYSHVYLNAEGVDLAQEIRTAKLDIEDKLGITIHSFAYPFGAINDEVVNKTSRFGYSSAVGLNNSITHNLSTIYYLSRIEIQNDYDMEKFKSFFPWSGPIQ